VTNEVASRTLGDADQTWNRDAFSFVQMLATELSSGRVQLPSYPEVALRVQRALTNDRSTNEMIVTAISTEPSLAVQIMGMANSSALNTTGERVEDLQSAVRRIGHSMIRAAALSFIMQQLRSADDLRPLRDRLNALWCRGVVVGAVCKATARRVRSVSPDAALLVGLLHGMGKLYILTRLAKHPHLLDKAGAAEGIYEAWHGSVAKSLLENWEMPEAFCIAVMEFESADRDMRGGVDLTDVLASANVLADAIPEKNEEPIDEAMLDVIYGSSDSLWQKLSLTRDQCLEIVLEAREERAQLRAMFSP
jgi:HD-like signal output (HDOD) protein